MAAIDVQGPTATAGDSQSAQEEPGNGDKMEESTRAESLPGYLPWENDLEMVSKYLDRKVSVVCVFYLHLNHYMFYLL